MTTIRPLVSTSWLYGKISNLPQNVKILDTSWTLIKSGKDDYLKKHVPRASFFDLNHCVKPTPTLPRNLPEPLCFRDYVRTLGVNTDSHIVVYDRFNNLASARAWWLFRVFGHDNVSVLDGGLKKWEIDGFETKSGEEESPQTGDFTFRMNYDLTKNYEAVNAFAEAGAGQLIDTRRPEHFAGKEDEPSSFTKNALEGMGQPMPSQMAAGHIPGAINLHQDLVLDTNSNCFLPAEQLNQLFTSKGIDLKKPTTAMCYNGHTACLLVLAMAVCGKVDTSVYYGSWTEYGQRVQIDPNTKAINMGKKSPTSPKRG